MTGDGRAEDDHTLDTVLLAGRSDRGLLDAGGGEPNLVREVFALERGPLSGDNLDLLAAVQDPMAAAQVDEARPAGPLPRLRDRAQAQGLPHHRGPDAVRQAAPAQPSLEALPVRAAAERLEAEVGDEQSSFLPALPGGAPTRAGSPRSGRTLTVLLDGGYVQSAHPRTRA